MTRWTLMPLTLAASLGLLLAGCQEERVVGEPAPAPVEPRVEADPPLETEIEDAAITTAVKSALVASPQVGALSIDVDTTRGIVTLTGTVETPAQKADAVRIARDVNDVRGVVDQLVVERPATP